MCWFSLSLSAESGATRKWREARSWLVKTRQHWASSGSLLSSMLSSMTRWSPLQHPHPHLHLHHQVTSKEVNRPCSVREELNSNLSIAGVLWGLVGCLLPSHLGMYTVHCTVCQVFKSLLLSSGNIWLWWLLSPFCTDLNVYYSFFRWPPWCWVQCLLLWGASAARLSPNLSMFLLSLSSQVGTKSCQFFLFEREI